MPSAGNSRTRSRGVAGLLALLAAVVLTTACLPAQPSVGRPYPVKRVLVMGDSMTFGLFGTTPRVHAPLGRVMADRGISLRIDGYPGETPIDAWPGNSGWLQRMEAHIASFDPDMVIIQSTLFPDADNPARRSLYAAAFARLLDVARSRGAHVYIVSHSAAPGSVERHARDVAQQLQAGAAAPRGVSTIPLDYWLGACSGPFVSDGWHLSAKGQDCHALALAVAVDQLRSAVG